MQQRRAVKRSLGRFAAVLATIGIIAVGAVSTPAQADTGWNRTIVPTKPSHP